MPNYTIFNLFGKNQDWRYQTWTPFAKEDIKYFWDQYNSIIWKNIDFLTVNSLGLLY